MSSPSTKNLESIAFVKKTNQSQHFQKDLAECASPTEGSIQQSLMHVCIVPINGTFVLCIHTLAHTCCNMARLMKSVFKDGTHFNFEPMDAHFWWLVNVCYKEINERKWALYKCMVISSRSGWSVYHLITNVSSDFTFQHNEINTSNIRSSPGLLHWDQSHFCFAWHLILWWISKLLPSCVYLFMFSYWSIGHSQAKGIKIVTMPMLKTDLSKDKSWESNKKYSLQVLLLSLYFIGSSLSLNCTSS